VSIQQVLIAIISFIVFLIPFWIIKYYLWNILSLDVKPKYKKIFAAALVILLGTVFWNLIALLSENNSWDLPIAVSAPVGIAYVASLYVPFIIVFLLVAGTISYFNLGKTE